MSSIDDEYELREDGNLERLKSDHNPLPQLTTLTSPNDPQLSTARSLLTSKSPRPQHLITEKTDLLQLKPVLLIKFREGDFSGWKNISHIGQLYSKPRASRHASKI